MGDKRDKTLSELAFTIADHQARIEKMGMKWAAILTDRLDATEKALMAEITAYMEKHSRGLNSLSSLTALHRLEKKIAAIRKEAFAHAQQEIMPEAGELADNEQKWAEKITGILAPESADKLSLVNKKALNDGLGKQLIESRTAEEWFSGTASADVMRINDMVREGVRSGWTIQEMTRRIVGTKANNYTDGLLETSRSHATTMARTLCCGVANNAKDQFYQENDDVVIGVEWLDTLDSRTCSRCGGLSRKRWKTKEPHPVPPAHHNCRCVLIPVTELTDLGDDAFRPAANADSDAEAKELYETKYPGRKFEDLAASTRKKYFYEAQKAYTARTGNPPYRQVPGGMTFSEYFEQMPEKEKERYLGPGRYEVWKNGNLPLTKFFPPYPERMYSVKELKEMDKKALKREPEKKRKAQKTKEELHQEHLEHRREQEKKAYENRLNKWKLEIVKNGGSDKIADVLADEYTLEVARIHKPPPVKFVRREKQTFCADDGSYIQLHKDPSNWYGYPDTARHEFLHWKHYWSMKKGIITPEELIEAAGKDYKSFLDNCRKSGISLDVFERSHAYDAVRKYYPDFKDDAESSAAFKLTSVVDAIGMMSDGKYGVGHSVSYYRRVNKTIWAQCETLAAIRLIKKDIPPFDFSNMRAILSRIGGQTMDSLAKLAQKNGYSAELVSFLKKSFQEWNKTDAEKAIMQKKSEKSIIQIILRPWCEGVFDDPEKEMQSCIDEGIEEYNAHCNPDGSFRYEDYV